MAFCFDYEVLNVAVIAFLWFLVNAFLCLYAVDSLMFHLRVVLSHWCYLLAVWGAICCR